MQLDSFASPASGPHPPAFRDPETVRRNSRLVWQTLPMQREREQRARDREERKVFARSRYGEWRVSFFPSF